MTFREWLVRQTDRVDIVGDVARDVADDPNTPEGYRGIRTYIESIAHHPDVLDCLDEAWREFKGRRSSVHRTKH